jgi:hypothetical protein
MIIDGDVRNENRRQYSRVEACIPFAHRLVPSEEQGKIRSHIGAAHSSSHKTLPDIQDPATAEWMNLLNSKLDTLIRLLTLEREGFYSLPFESINIGGGGLRFLSGDKYTVGDTLEIRMILSLIHSTALYVYATVFSISDRNRDGAYETAVQFIKMDDVIQDEIIRFVFEREREILRSKKGQ